MVAPSGGPVLPFHKTFAASAIAACTAEIMTLPLGGKRVQEGCHGSLETRETLAAWFPPASDTAKVKLQLQPKTAAPKYK